MLLPLWTIMTELTPRSLDPLGLSRVSENIVWNLLPGITVSTRLGRNYGFYCWAVAQALKEADNTQFLTQVARYEAAYVIASLLDAENNFLDAKGPIGNNRGVERIQTARSEEQSEISIDFSVLKNPFGGFKQYYKASMEFLGLVFGDSSRFLLSDKGREMADAYENSIRDTEYFRDNLDKTVIELRVLKEYGEKCSHLRMNQFRGEQEIFCDVFFCPNQNNSVNPLSRMATLCFILSLFNYYSEKGYNISDSEFRTIVYYGQSIHDGNLVEFQSPINLISEVMSQWRFFQFHEYFTLVLENILASFIYSLEENPNGLSKGDFIDIFTVSSEVISDYLGIEVSGKSISEIIDQLLSLKKIPCPLDTEASKMFDTCVRIQDPLSEHNISIQLINSKKRGEYPCVIGYAMLLLIVLIIRYWQYMDDFSEQNIWIIEREMQHWSLRSYIAGIQGEMGRISLEKLFKKLVDELIQQHYIIAYEKMQSGIATFRFEQRGERFFYKQKYDWVLRNNRFDSIRSLFEDVGIIHKDSDLYSITDFGAKTMTRYLR